MLHYNNIYNYITGLTNSRFVHAADKPGNQPKALPRMEEGVMSKGELEAQLAKYEKGEVVAAAGETDVEYRARVDKEIADTKRQLKEIEQAQKAKGGAYIEKVKTPYGTVHSLRGHPRLRKKEKFTPGTRKEKEPTAEVAEAPVLDYFEDKADDAQHERVMAMTDKPPKPTYKRHADTEAEYAANEPETKATEMAYLQQQMKNPSNSMVADYVAISKRIDEALLIPGTTIENAVTELQEDIPRLTADIGYMGEVAKAIQEGGNKVNAKSLVEGLKDNASSDKVKKMFDDRLEMVS